MENESYYAVVVLDKVGLPINGVTVKLTQNNITDSDETVEGIRIFTDNSNAIDGFVLDYSKPYTLLVVDKSGTYFPFENTQFYLDESTHITYVTLSSVPTVSGVNASYDVEAKEKLEEILTKDALGSVVGDGHHVVDMNSETAKINTWLTEKVDLRVSCGMDPDVAINGVSLVQNGKVIKTITDATALTQISTEKSGEEYGNKRIVELLLRVETSHFEKEQDVYAVVDFSDGSQVSTKLNLQIFELNFHNIDMGWLTNGFNLEFSSEAKEFLKPILDGKGLKLLPNLDLQFDIAIAPDSFKIQLGIKGEKSIWGDEKDNKPDFDNNDNLTLKQINDKFISYCNLLNSIKGGRKPNFEDKKGAGIEGSLSGFMEIKHNGLDENGKPDISYETGIIGAVMVNYEHGYTMPTPIAIPVRVEVETSFGGELIFKLVFDEEAGKYLADSLKFELKGSIVARAGIGFAMLSVGIYGKLETVVVFEIAPAPEVESWTLEGDLGLYLKYNGLFIKKTFSWSLLKALGLEAKMVIFEDGVWFPDFKKHATRSGDISLLQDLYDESTYTIATSSYDPKTKRSAGSAYNGIEPQMMQVGDLVYLVYQDDLARYHEAEDKYYYTAYKDAYNTDLYDLYNYQKIVYQIYDTKTGEISSPVVLDDNGFADGAFRLYQNGADAVIAYTQMSQKLNAENIDDMAGYLGSLDVRTAVLNREKTTFAVSETALTNDTFYDTNLRVGEINGQITAVWVRNEENTMFSTDNRNMSVWYSVYNGDTWCDPVCLKEGLDTVTDLEIGNNRIAYVIDTNNDLATTDAARETEGNDDKTVTMLDITGNVLLHTAEKADYNDVTFFDDTLTWYADNNLYQIDTREPFFEQAMEEFPENYTLLTDATGNVKAILFAGTVVYSEESGASGSDVFGIFRNGDTWGAPVRLTEFGEGVYVTSFDAVDQGNQVLISALLSEVSQNKDATQETEAYTSSYRFVTCLLDYPTGYTMGEVTCDPATVAPNTPTTLTVQISNQGCTALTEVPVTVTRAGATVYTGTATKFYDADGKELTGGLLSGHTAQIKVTFDPGSVSGDPEYTLHINGQTDTQKLWYSDFEVTGKQILIGDTYYIVARVANNGHVPAAYTFTAELGNSEDLQATVITLGETYVTRVLSHGESQYFTIPLPFKSCDDGNNLVFIQVDADGEYFQTNNIAKINITTEEFTEVSTESLSVWISETSVLIDRDATKDTALEFSDGYTLVSVTIDETDAAGLYTAAAGSILLREADIAQNYANGTHFMRLQFTDGSVDADGKPIYKYATVKLIITQYFRVQWIVDGEILATDTFEIGTVPAIGDPVKEKDAQYTYTFAGWDCNSDGIADEILAAERDITYTALFSGELNPYTVTWSVDDKLTTAAYLYGTVPAYEGTPEKVSDVQYDYVFAGWDKEIAAVTGDVTYTAVFDAVIRKYTVTLDVDGTQSTMQVEYGVTPVLPEAVKTSDAQYAYTFTGWSPAISPVYGNQTYTAQFTSTLRQYTVTWSIDGNKTMTVCNYGSVPTFNATPYKPSDDMYIYHFTGWDKELVAVTGDVTYTAVFGCTLRSYTVSFVVDNTVWTQTCTYGEIPVFTGDTHKNTDENYRYIFTGWDRELVAVTGDTTYTAQYDAIVLGSATITHTAFETAWNHTFTTTVSLSDVKNMTDTTISLYYDPQLVTLRSWLCGEGVRVLAEETGYITIAVTGLSENSSCDLLTLTFLTSNYAPVGQTDFLAASCVDKLTANFGTLRLYQPGDVNMDGRVNTIDAAMVQRYSVQKLSLTDVQKVYANVTGDYDADGFDLVNTVDAAMIQRYALKKLDTLGKYPITQ